MADGTSAWANDAYPYAARRVWRRATPAALMGVSGRPTRAWALSTEAEMPPCLDKVMENSVAQAKVESAIAVFLTILRLMFYLQC